MFILTEDFIISQLPKQKPKQEILNAWITHLNTLFLFLVRRSLVIIHIVNNMQKFKKFSTVIITLKSLREVEKRNEVLKNKWQKTVTTKFYMFWKNKFCPKKDEDCPRETGLHPYKMIMDS